MQKNDSLTVGFNLYYVQIPRYKYGFKNFEQTYTMCARVLEHAKSAKAVLTRHQETRKLYQTSRYSR